MKSNIFIPKRIKVGFCNRTDTYTKKLAYVVYFDQLGKLRKETSWENWRDKKIEPEEYDNEPLTGFVLNKKVGGYSSSWNFRQAYVRVYDPRGFEFEITVPNLIYILENTSSIVGKGLEGEFIYGWDSKDIILLPACSPDYIAMQQYNDLIHSKSHVKGSELKIGCTYRSKKDKILTYMGRFDHYCIDNEWISEARRYNSFVKMDGQFFYFAKNEELDLNYGADYKFTSMKSVGNTILEIVSDTPSPEYANLMELLEHTSEYSPINEQGYVYIPYTFEEFKEIIENKYSSNFNLGASKKTIDIMTEYNKIDNKRELTGMCFYYKDTYRYDKKQYLTYELMFEEIKPHYKQTYLMNGKLYREDKISI